MLQGYSTGYEVELFASLLRDLLAIDKNKVDTVLDSFP